MTDHRNWALATLIVFVMLMVVTVRRYIKNQAINWLIVCGFILGLVLLGSAAWRGGEVVYRYGLGVMSMPSVKAEGDDVHDHQHVSPVLENKMIDGVNMPHGEKGHAH